MYSSLKGKERKPKWGHSVMSDSFRPHELQPTRFLHPWFSRQEYWSGLPFPSPGDLPNLGNEPGIPHYRQMLYRLSHQGSHYRGLECKSRKSRDTWSNKQIWPWSTKWNRSKANRVLPKERTGHSKCPLPTTQEKTLHMDITRWSISKSDWLYSFQSKMEKLYTVSKNKTGS